MLKRWFSVIALLAINCATFDLQANVISLPTEIHRLGSTPTIRFDPFGRLVEHPLFQRIACPKPDDVFTTLFVVGQSNAANHGFGVRSGHFALENLVFFNNFACWRSIGTDAALGATGTGSHWMGELAKTLKQKTTTKPFVVVGLFSVHGRKLSAFTANGALASCVRQEVGQFAGKFGLKHLTLLQGESDVIAGTSADQYGKQLTHFIEHCVSVSTRCSVSIVTRCPAAQINWRTENAISIAQRDTVRSSPYFTSRLREGPNVDTLVDETGRYDSCHLNQVGLAIVGRAVGKLILSEMAEP